MSLDCERKSESAHRLSKCDKSASSPRVKHCWCPMKGLNHFLWLINKGKVFVLRVRKANARKTQTLWSKSRPVKTSACFFHSAGASSRRRLAQEQQWRLTRILPFIFNIFIHMTKHFLQKYKTCEINSQAGVRSGLTNTLEFRKTKETIAARFFSALPEFLKITHVCSSAKVSAIQPHYYRSETVMYVPLNLNITSASVTS